MSEPYTPTTARVRGFYRSATAWTFDHDPQPHIAAMMEKQAAEFDRWLANVKAEAWDEGNRFGIAKHCESGCYEDRERNPYRNGEGRHVDQ